MDHTEPQRSSIFLREFLAAPRNREAFGQFVARYQPRIKDCCRQRWQLQDADAEDLSASILLRFLERDVLGVFVFQSKEKFYHWLDTVVKSAVLSFLRDRGREPDAWSVGNVEAQEALEKVAEDVGLFCAEDYARVQAARARVEKRVDPKTARAFRMLVDEGAKVEEVVRTLGMTKVAVWQARSRFLRLLREEFRDLDGFSDP